MTPYESFFFIKNGSSKLKQLVLVTFLLLQYLYILSYHPVNLTSFIMPEILTETRLKRNLLNIRLGVSSLFMLLIIIYMKYIYIYTYIYIILYYIYTYIYEIYKYINIYRYIYIYIWNIYIYMKYINIYMKPGNKKQN